MMSNPAPARADHDIEKNHDISNESNIKHFSVNR